MIIYNRKKDLQALETIAGRFAKKWWVKLLKSQKKNKKEFYLDNN